MTRKNKVASFLKHREVKKALIVGVFTCIAAIIGCIGVIVAAIIRTSTVDKYLEGRILSTSIHTPTYEAGTANAVPTMVTFIEGVETDQESLPVVTPLSVGSVLLNVNFLADKQVVSSGEVITYLFVIENNSPVTIDPTYLIVNLSPYVKYIPGSTQASKSGASVINVHDDWHINGFNLGSLRPSQHLRLDFKVRVNEDVDDQSLIENVIQIKKTWLSPGVNEWIQCAVQTTAQNLP